MDLRVYKTNSSPYHSNYVIIKIRWFPPPLSALRLFVRISPPNEGFTTFQQLMYSGFSLEETFFELRSLFNVTTKLSLSSSSYHAVILEVILSTEDRNTPKSRHVSPRHNSVGCVSNFTADTRALI